MHFDDRLATVLRHRVAGARAARTQFRQLLDLLGRAEQARDGALLAAAWRRLDELRETLSAGERAAIIREPGFRIRSPGLAAHFSEQEPEVAAAALATARLDDKEWIALIPRLPVRSRGFLRLRNDLSAEVAAALERLGVHDRGLPMPSAGEREESAAEAAEPRVPHQGQERSSDDSIGNLVQRIAAYRHTRGEAPAATAASRPDEAPLLPLGQPETGRAPAPASAFSFTTDAQGALDWANDEVLPMVFGLRLRDCGPADSAIASLTSRKQPLRSVPLILGGAAAISGEWVVDAAPRFAPEDGRFIGYAGRFRRRAEANRERGSASGDSADRLRQLLHELRTPVNAIQGFAEVIQQQFFGPVPHQYRALAANIAGDAARILAGFDELERLARLESGALALEKGESDALATIRSLSAQLEESLAAREVTLRMECAATTCPVTIDAVDMEVLAWRFLAALAEAAEEKEQIVIECRIGDGTLRLSAPLPRSIVGREDLFSALPDDRTSGPGAGMFGFGFALRLARGEARSAGGDLRRNGDLVELLLPMAPDGQPATADAEKREYP